MQYYCRFHRGRLLSLRQRPKQMRGKVLQGEKCFSMCGKRLYLVLWLQVPLVRIQEETDRCEKNYQNPYSSMLTIAY